MDADKFWSSSGAAAPLPGEKIIPKSWRASGGTNFFRANSGSPTNLTKCTLSIWTRLADFATRQGVTEVSKTLIESKPTGWTNGDLDLRSEIRHYGQKFQVVNYADNGASFDNIDGVYHDMTGWYHIYMVWDTTQSTQSERFKYYINGHKKTVSAGNYEKDQEIGFCKDGWTVNVGCLKDASGDREYWTGYIAELHVVDGTAHDVDKFGFYTDLGVWVPREYKGGYGNNGFYLPFKSGSTPGEDLAGGPDFVWNGPFNSARDSTKDSPQNIRPCWNSLAGTTRAGQGQQTSNVVVSEAGYKATSTADRGVVSTHAIPAKIYSNGTYNGVWAFEGGKTVPESQHDGLGWQSLDDPSYFAFYRDNGVSHIDGVVSAAGTYPTYTTGHTIGCVLNLPEGKIKFFREGVFIFEAPINPEAMTHRWAPSGILRLSTGTGTSGLYQSYDSIYYSYPDVAKPQCTLLQENWPTLPIPDPKEHFQVVLANGSDIQTEVTSKFTNNVWLIKDRENSNEWQLSWNGGINATLTPSGVPNTPYTAPTGQSVGYVWNLGEDFTSAGNGGSFSQYWGTPSCNKTSGVGKIAYKTSSATDLYLKHNLNSTPEFIIYKNGSVTGPHHVYHKDIGPNASLNLNNSSNISNTPTDLWQSNAPDNTYIYLGASLAETVATHEIYYWHNVPGYSHFGTYQGNGATDLADCPFINLGFQPALVWLKSVNENGDWWMFDTARDLQNPAGAYLYTNDTRAESTSGSDYLRITSNGFYVTPGNSQPNTSGYKFIYCAWAEHPGLGNNVRAANAR